MSTVVQQDGQKVVIDYLATLLPTLTPGTYTVGSKVKPATTPTRFVRVRLVDGESMDRVGERPVLQVQVWGAGGVTDEADAARMARILCANLQRALRARVAVTPRPLPDPVDSARSLVQLTIQIPLRGTQT